MMILQDTVRIRLHGVPQGKGAARHTSRGFTYTPTKTRDYMALLSAAARASGASPRQDPCTLDIRAYFPIPESHPAKLKASIRAGEVYYTKKPDTDNLSKIKDALNGIAFHDDALVWKETITKFYSDNPRLEITINYQPSQTNGELGYVV